MSINKKELEKIILEHTMEHYEEPALELWVEIADEGYDVDYEIVEEGGKKKAKAVDPLDAQAKNFGSGTLQIPALFWFNEAVAEWEERTDELNDK